MFDYTKQRAMQTLTTSSYDEALKKLSPIKKTSFLRWHSEGEFKLLTAGNYYLPSVLEALSDFNFDWSKEATSTSRPPSMHKHEKAYMFTNLVQEFVLVINDMQASDYSRQMLEDTGKQHIIIYLVEKDK